MPHHVAIDFETRSRVSLTVHGSARYFASPSTEALMMAYSVDGGEPNLWLQGQPFPEVVLTANQIHAHNAAFERNVIGRTLGYTVPLQVYKCSALRASYSGLARSLDAAGRVLGVTQRKDEEGHKLMLKMCAPDKDGNWVGGEEELRRLGEYCLQDVRTEVAIERSLPEVHPREYDYWAADRIMNERGAPCDVELCRGAIEILTEARRRITIEATDLTDGVVTKGTQVARIQKFVNERGVNIDNLQEATVAAELEANHPPDVEAILKLRQAAASAAAGKFQAAQNRVSPDGRLREQYMFYGTHTGRRSGAGGIQIQNIKTSRLISDPLLDAIKTGDIDWLELQYNQPAATLLGAAARGIICAPEGAMLVIADFSQIECRLTHWLSNNAEMLKWFAEGGDPYIAFAKVFFSTDNVTKQQRNYSKPIMLGGGYGMGAKRLVQYAKVYQVELTVEEAKKTIDVFRKQNWRIVKLWAAIDKAVALCVQQGRDIRCGKLLFRSEGRWMTVQIPSGRKLFYFRPEFAEGRYGPRFIYHGGPGTPTPMWGGSFLENFCQAITRDLCMEAQLKCEAVGLPVVLDQHDEIGCEVAQEDAEAARVKLETLMCDKPEWARGLPVAAEGRVRKIFVK